MTRALITPGDKYNRWTILEEVKSRTKHRRVLCQCACGTKRVVLLQSLLDSTSKSCGCSHNGAKAATKTLYRNLWERENERSEAVK